MLFTVSYVFFFLITINIIEVQASKLRLDWMVYILAWYFIAEFTLFLRNRLGSDVKVTGVFLLTFLLATIENLLSTVNIYRFGPLVNRVEHFLGTLIIAYVTTKLYLILKINKKITVNHVFELLVLSTTIAFGVLNEIIEYFSDTLLGSHHIGSGYDTQLDLIMNLLGAGVFTIYLLIKKRRFPDRDR